MLIDCTNPVTDWIFPRRCLVCHLDIAQQNICVTCLSLCHIYPIISLLNTKNYAAIYYFELVIKQLIKNAKFYKNILHAHLLITLIKKQLLSSDLINQIQLFAPSVITYVPTHWLNRLNRTIDLPQFFAQLLSDQLYIPVRPLLSRTQFHSRQVLRTTRNERIVGIKGSFKLNNKLVSYERILLVDDIVTTGATFDESKKMLREICNNILCLAIAKTP